MLSSFYEKISTPVLTNLELEVDGVTVYDLYPEPLPDLFQGSQLVITGRYRDGGSAEILLKGQTNSKPQIFQYKNMKFTEERGHSGSKQPFFPTRSIVWPGRASRYTNPTRPANLEYAGGAQSAISG